MFIKYFGLHQSQTDGMKRKLEVIKRNNEINESCNKHDNINGNNNGNNRIDNVVLIINISSIIFTMNEFNCLLCDNYNSRNMENNSYILVYFYVCILTSLSSPILFHFLIKHKAMSAQYLVSHLVWNRNDYSEWSTLLQELNPNCTIEIIIEIVRILVIPIVVNKQLEYQKQCKKRKNKTDITSPMQQQRIHLILFDEDGDDDRSMGTEMEDEQDSEFAAGVARAKQVVNTVEHANNNSYDATASVGNQLGLIHSPFGANNNHNINNINNNNSTKNKNNNKNYKNDGKTDMDDCQHTKKNEKTKIQMNKNHKSPHSKSKKNNDINNKEININNNKRRNNQANRSAVAMYANRTEEDVTSPMLKPADDNDDNEETYTLNYDHIGVTKGRVSNTPNDVHVNLTNVIGHNGDAPVTNNTINTNTYVTRLSKTIENTYGGIHMSNRPVYGDYNSLSMRATLGLKDRFTNNDEVSSYGDCSNNTSTNNNNNNDDVKGKYNNNDNVDPTIAIAETLRQLNGGYSVYIDCGAGIGAGNVAITRSSHTSTRTTNTHIVNTINALNKTLSGSSDMRGASPAGCNKI